ncbi:TPA: radical SAM protein [Enterococcus faecalis]|nr:radical SAM protein [Enterococcus faecalis]
MGNGTPVFPKIIDIHPVNGRCNLNCTWCIGQKGYVNIPSVTDNFKKEEIMCLMDNIFRESYRSNWPLEVHICGCDSEPLLKWKEVSFLIKELRKKNVTTELITNGLLIDKRKICDLLNLDKISISLDVVNDKDFYIYKVNNSAGERYGFSKIIDKIKLITEQKKLSNSSVSIYVTFVATENTFDYETWEEAFRLLKEVGVNHIQVREDINGTRSAGNYLSQVIANISKRMSADTIDYEKENHFDIKYHSPSSEENIFTKCISPLFWPAITMDLQLRRCAHTALSIYEPLTDLKVQNYYEYYEKCSHIEKNVNYIGCDKKCPPTLSRINSKFYKKRKED